MSFFDNLQGNNQKLEESIYPLSNAESVMAIILAITAVDGNISDDEIEDFKRIINKSKLIRDLNDFEYQKAVGKVFDILESDGAIELATTGALYLDSEFSEAMFVNACDMLFSDGNIADEEKKLMELLQEKLSIADYDAEDIVKFISLKNSL